MKNERENDLMNPIPDGCYECGVHDEDLEKEGYEEIKEFSVDLQGNGYPMDLQPEKK